MVSDLLYYDSFLHINWNVFVACDGGSWGDNCERRCLGCHDEKCDRFSGRCHGLCKPGFKQTDYCDQG